MSHKTPRAIRATIIGGLLFLIPFVLVVALGGKAYQVMRKIAEPIANALGIDHVGFVAVIDLVTLLITLLICYVAGLVATSERGRRVYEALDERLLDIWPRYAFIKLMASGVAREQAEHMRAVIVHLDDQSQLAFEVERNDTHVVVFVPGSPDPWSGAVSTVTCERVVAVDATVQSLTKVMRGAGRGFLELKPTSGS